MARSQPITDTNKARALWLSAKSFALSEPKRALAMALEAAELCDPADTEQRARCLATIGYLHSQLGEKTAGLRSVNAALRLLRSNKHRETHGRILGTRASIQATWGELTPALGSYRKAMQQIAPGTLPEADMLLGFGVTLQRCGRPVEAADYLLRALRGYQSNGVAPHPSTYGSLAELYLELRDRKRSRHYFTLAERAARASNDTLSLASVAIGLGRLALGAKERESARRHFTRAATLAHKLGAITTEIEALGRLADSFRESSIATATKHAAVALALAERAEDQRVRHEALLRLANCHIAAHRYEDALGLLARAMRADSSAGVLTAQTLELAAEVHAVRSDHAAAYRSLRKSQRVREELARDESKRAIAAEQELARTRSHEARMREMASVDAARRSEVSELLRQIESQRQLIRGLRRELQAAARAGEPITTQSTAGVPAGDDATLMLKAYGDAPTVAIMERFPALSLTEARVSALLRLALPSKDVALLLGMSVRTVEWHRAEIRKKLKLGRRESLSSHLIQAGTTERK